MTLAYGGVAVAVRASGGGGQRREWESEGQPLRRMERPITTADLSSARESPSVAAAVLLLPSVPCARAERPRRAVRAARGRHARRVRALGAVSLGKQFSHLKCTPSSLLYFITRINNN